MKENMKDENVIDVRKIIAKIWHKESFLPKFLPVVFSCVMYLYRFYSSLLCL